MSDTKAMQRLCGLMRKAVQQYEMLAPGDRVLVGVSGGKDSVALTIGLARLRQYLGFPFEVVAVTLDPQFGGKPVDYSALEALFRQYDVSYEVRRTLIGPIVFDYRNEKNPCSLCAKMRRGALHTAAEELDCKYLLLDSFVKGQAGGTGKLCNIDVVKNAEIHLPYFLAGGINERNLADMLTVSQNIDISGGTETDGVKDREKIKRIMEIYNERKL